MRGTSTIVAFYQSAYGPAIRIDVQDIEWLVMFKKALALLTSKAISELDVLSLRNIKKGNIAGFRIVFGTYADVSSVSI